MIETLIFLAIALIAVLTVLVLVGMLISFAIAKLLRNDTKTHRRVMKITAIVFAVAVVCAAGLAAVTQWTASTPAIKDSDGNIPAGSIAELTRVELNGRKEWISLRGWDASNPVLLFLAGGPGGTQMAAARYELAELEKHFVVVNWDQPGSGKSYSAAKAGDLTAETYVADGYALTQYLQSRFAQEKIYLIGESWGSALAIFLADRHPDAYYAVIGTGQMIDFAQTERMDYEKAMELAQQRGDSDFITRLEANGVPPYYGKDVVWKSALYLNYLSAYMASDPAIANPGYNTLRDIFAPEYGLIDKLNYARGVITTFNHVYPQLYTIDLRKDYPELDVPVYFFLGRHDLNAPVSLVEEYMETLSAPQKEIVWFEQSGHSPWINERDAFSREVLARFTQSK